MSAFELVSYEPHHREDYLRLLRGAWGEGAMSGEEFDWWFDGNPAGSLRSVAVMDDRVVAVAGHSLYAVALEGELRTASFSVHAVTHPSARGRGIFVELERKHEREAQEMGVACVLGVRQRAHSAALPRAARVDGDREAPRVGAAGVAEPPPPRRTWPATPMMRRPTGRTTSSATANTSGGAISTRRAATRLFATDAGYAVVWPAKRHKGRTISVVADHVGPTELLSEARQRARARLQFALPAPEQRRAYLAAGFLPTPQTLNFMGKALAVG